MMKDNPKIKCVEQELNELLQDDNVFPGYYIDEVGNVVISSGSVRDQGDSVYIDINLSSTDDDKPIHARLFIVNITGEMTVHLRNRATSSLLGINVAHIRERLQNAVSQHMVV